MANQDPPHLQDDDNPFNFRNIKPKSTSQPEPEFPTPSDEEFSELLELADDAIQEVDATKQPELPVDAELPQELDLSDLLELEETDPLTENPASGPESTTPILTMPEVEPSPSEPSVDDGIDFSHLLGDNFDQASISQVSSGGSAVNLGTSDLPEAEDPGLSFSGNAPVAPASGWHEPALPAAEWDNVQNTLPVSSGEVVDELFSASGLEPTDRIDPNTTDKTEELEASLLDDAELNALSILAGGGESGVNLMLDDSVADPSQAGSRSSILGNAAIEDASEIDLDALPANFGEAPTEAIGMERAPESNVDLTQRMTVPSSEWDEVTIDMSPQAQDLEDPAQVEEVVEWKVSPDEIEPTRHDPPTDFEALIEQEKAESHPAFALPQGIQETDFESQAFADADDAPIPVPDASGRGASGKSSRTQPDDSEDDEPIRPSRRDEKPVPKKGGVLGWIGGGVLGLLLGAGGVAGAYFAGLLPKSGDTSPRPIASAPGSNADSAELAKLRSELASLREQAEQATSAAKLRETELLNAVDTEQTKLAMAVQERDDAKLLATDSKKALDTALADLKKATAEADSAKKLLVENDKLVLDLKKMITDNEKLVTESKTARMTAEAAILDAMKKVAEAQANLKAAETAADEAKKALDAKAKQVQEAEVAAKLAMTKLTEANQTVDTLVKELKANKLLDEKDDTPAALAKLPAILKQASTAATSADAKKAAEALALAKKENELLQAEMKATAQKMAKLQEDVKLYSEKAQEALLKADQEAKKAAAVAKAEAMKDYESQLTALQKKLTDADASLKKAMAEAEIAQKTAQDETARQLANLKKEQAAELSKILAGHAREVAGLNGQIALLRSGAKVAITSQEVLQSDRAATAYSKGLLAYFDRNYSDAESRLLQATKDYPNDARYWYFLGLAQFELGKRSDAETAFQKGADLELQFQPSSREVATSLERVQGPARRLLNKYRP